MKKITRQLNVLKVCVDRNKIKDSCQCSLDDMVLKVKEKVRKLKV